MAAKPAPGRAERTLSDLSSGHRTGGLTGGLGILAFRLALRQCGLVQAQPARQIGG